MTLSAKHKNVITAYMKCFNKKQALMDAGYTETTARTRAKDVFGRPEVIEEIERRQNLAAHRADMSMDWIVERLRLIADANLGDALDVYSDGSANINFNKLTPALKKSLTKFSSSTRVGGGKGGGDTKEIRVAFSDQLKALELLVRHLGLSKEKTSVEVSGEASLIEALHAGRTRAGINDD